MQIVIAKEIRLLKNAYASMAKKQEELRHRIEHRDSMANIKSPAWFASPEGDYQLGRTQEMREVLLELDLELTRLKDVIKELEKL